MSCRSDFLHSSLDTGHSRLGRKLSAHCLRGLPKNYRITKDALLSPGFPSRFPLRRGSRIISGENPVCAKRLLFTGMTCCQAQCCQRPEPRNWRMIRAVSGLRLPYTLAQSLGMPSSVREVPRPNSRPRLNSVQCV